MLTNAICFTLKYRTNVTKRYLVTIPIGRNAGLARPASVRLSHTGSYNSKTKGR